ncbi:MAG: amidohydrolase [Chthoniobacterales bacterium]
MKTAGIDKSTIDPELGRIDRDSKTGEATGALRETAVGLVEKHVPPPTPEDMEAALRYAQSHLHSLGVTSILDANVSPAMLEAYQRAQSSGILTLKVVAALATDPTKPMDQVDEMVRLRKQFSNGRVTVGTAKIFVDGVLEGKTAALLEPYEGTDYKGFMNWNARQLSDIVTRLDKQGFQVYMHAIGDAAVRAGLNAIEAARVANGPSDNRHQITHVEMVSPSDLPRFAKLDVIANFQPFWWSFTKGKDDHRVSLVGIQRAEQFYPVRKILSHGARIVEGSDWPITEANPFHGIEAALVYPANRAPSTDDTGASLDLETLLAAYTIDGAFASHREKEIGSISMGKAADFIVIDRDLFAATPAEVGETIVLSTFVDGKPVFEKGKARATDEPLIPVALNNLLSRIHAGMTIHEVETVLSTAYPGVKGQMGEWSGQTGYIDYKLTERYTLSVSSITRKGEAVVHDEILFYLYDWPLKHRFDLKVYEWEKQAKEKP